KRQGTKIVATPMGGTHLEPNSPENILNLIENNIDVSIATDAYLPPYPQASWLPFKDQSLQGPDVLVQMAHPGMQLLQEKGVTENEIVAQLAAVPANILGMWVRLGSLQEEISANSLLTNGISAVVVTVVEDIGNVSFRGVSVVY